MTHAEQYSTSEPGDPRGVRTRSVKRTGAILTLAAATVLASLIVTPIRPSSADQLSDAKAEAAALSAKLNAEESEIQTLTGQYDQASYQLSQVDASIAATRAQLAKDQATVDKDESQLRTQAVNDYMTNGTSSQLTQMFSGDNNTVNIRNEYSTISSGNVTNTVDSLHTAQSHLQQQQAALQQQQAQATAATDALASSKTQASALASQLQQQKSSADAQVQNIINQQAAAAAAAAQAAANAKLAAAKAAQNAAAAAAAAQNHPTAGNGGAGEARARAPR